MSFLWSWYILGLKLPVFRLLLLLSSLHTPMLSICVQVSVEQLKGNIVILTLKSEHSKYFLFKLLLITVTFFALLNKYKTDFIDQMCTDQTGFDLPVHACAVKKTNWVIHL